MTDLTKQKKIQQKMNRIKEQEAKLKTQERKIRTQKLIELGGLVKKADLDSLSSNCLYGALLFIKEQSLNPEKIKQWEHLGGSTFNKEKQLSTLKTISVRFDEKPTQQLKNSLKNMGLKWNALRSEFEGKLDLEKSKADIESLNGKITILNG